MKQLKINRQIDYFVNPLKVLARRYTKEDLRRDEHKGSKTLARNNAS